MHSLLPHPDHPPQAAKAIGAEIRREGSIWRVDYLVSGGIRKIRLPAIETPTRRDGLWQETCFELFAMNADKSYREFNFSPSTCFAAYAFDGYREGMRDAAATIAIETKQNATEYRLTARISANLGDAERLALTAIIEEEDGRKSYWALAHPQGAPDFHDEAGFAIRIEDIA